MMYQWPLRSPESAIDAGRQLAQLRQVLALVAEIAGEPERLERDWALEEAATASEAYERLEPIARRRFDALALETAAWSAAGVEALLKAGEPHPKAAARQLASELVDALRRLRTLLGL